MNQQTSTAALVLRIALAALILAHASLQFVALGIPAFGADLAAMGMSLGPSALLALLELAAAVALLFGLPRRRAQALGLRAPA